VKTPCWRCIAVGILSLPFGLGYLVYQRYKHQTEFITTLRQIRGGLTLLQKFMEETRGKEADRPQKAE
jgi:hypothetical protein